MKDRTVRARRAVPFGMALLAVCCQSLPMSCAADKSTPALQPNQDLVQEKANTDDRPIAAPVEPTPEQKRLLNGQVTREDSNAPAEQPSPPVPSAQTGTMDLSTALNALRGAARSPQTADLDRLQDAMRSLDVKDLRRLQSSHGFHLTINGQGVNFTDLHPQRPTMSPEEFRKLEYGVIGMESIVQFGAPNPVITVVYPTCPAANAGIRKGDTIVKANEYVFKPGDGQRVLWQVVGGKANTPVDITVLREGQLITFHLMRMNIEDIEDVDLRHTFESLLSQLGPPTYNQ